MVGVEDANVTQTGDQVILVGAASKGIIQRGFQHNAMVYKTPYAKNPFDTITDEELEEYKKVIERKQKGESFDEDHSESEPLSSSLQNSRPTNDSVDILKSPLLSPNSAASETEEESKDEPRVLRIETKQAPRPSQAEVVLSDAELDLPDPNVERSMSLRYPVKVADATDVAGNMNRSRSLGRDKMKGKDIKGKQVDSFVPHQLAAGSLRVPNPVHFHIAHHGRFPVLRKPIKAEGPNPVHFHFAKNGIGRGLQKTIQPEKYDTFSKLKSSQSGPCVVPFMSVERESLSDKLKRRWLASSDVSKCPKSNMEGTSFNHKVVMGSKSTTNNNILDKMSVKFKDSDSKTPEFVRVSNNSLFDNLNHLNVVSSEYEKSLKLGSVVSNQSSCESLLSTEDSNSSTPRLSNTTNKESHAHTLVNLVDTDTNSRKPALDKLENANTLNKSSDSDESGVFTSNCSETKEIAAPKRYDGNAQCLGFDTVDRSNLQIASVGSDTLSVELDSCKVEGSSPHINCYLTQINTSESAMNEKSHPNQTDNNKTSLNENSLRNKTLHSQPSMNENSQLSKTLHSQPSTNENSQLDKTIHSKPSLNENSQFNKTASSHPSQNEDLQLNQMVISQTSQNENLHLNKTERSQPSLNQNLQIDQTVNYQPSLNEISHLSQTDSSQPSENEILQLNQTDKEISRLIEMVSSQPSVNQISQLMQTVSSHPSVNEYFQLNQTGSFQPMTVMVSSFEFLQQPCEANEAVDIHEKHLKPLLNHDISPNFVESYNIINSKALASKTVDKPLNGHSKLGSYGPESQAVESYRTENLGAEAYGDELECQAIDNCDPECGSTEIYENYHKTTKGCDFEYQTTMEFVNKHKAVRKWKDGCQAIEFMDEHQKTERQNPEKYDQNEIAGSYVDVQTEDLHKKDWDRMPSFRIFVNEQPIYEVTLTADVRRDDCIDHDLSDHGNRDELNSSSEEETDSDVLTVKENISDSSSTIEDELEVDFSIAEQEKNEELPTVLLKNSSPARLSDNIAYNCNYKDSKYLNGSVMSHLGFESKLLFDANRSNMFNSDLSTSLDEDILLPSSSSVCVEVDAHIATIFKTETASNTVDVHKSISGEDLTLSGFSCDLNIPKSSLYLDYRSGKPLICYTMDPIYVEPCDLVAYMPADSVKDKNKGTTPRSLTRVLNPIIEENECDYDSSKLLTETINKKGSEYGGCPQLPAAGKSLERENTMNGDDLDGPHSTLSQSSKEGGSPTKDMSTEESPKKDKKKKKGLSRPSFLRKKEKKKKIVEA
uniref:Uncharacterized protein n=2 Tax=Timema TaxID=61471 RepID=A0A7R9ATM4_TIMSH|nr:unnamed protein product [Timema shepardi]